ncbi:MAG: glycosyltransferase family 2 protein [Planctomycetota bacterium]
MSSNQTLSVVVPCYNEQEVLEQTHRRLSEVLAGLENLDYEIVYVDDGSVDGTGQILRRLARDDRRVRVVIFSRNFGHQQAVTAGIDHASGDGVVVIDADLQDPPEVILEMVSAWRSGADVAYGVRTERQGDSLFKRATAKGFYRVIHSLSEVRIPPDTGDFRLMDRRVVRALGQMNEQDRYLRGMVSWLGFNQQPVKFKRHARLAGQTKYPLRKMIRFAVDGILSFSQKPLRLATWLGLFAAFAAFAGILWVLVVRLIFNQWVAGWASILVAILFLGGVQLICMGILGEYVGRIYRESKSRPLYLVKDTLGFQKDTNNE